MASMQKTKKTRRNMKLRNKKTGEIKTTDKVGLLGRNNENVWSTGEYASLAELCGEEEE